MTRRLPSVPTVAAIAALAAWGFFPVVLLVAHARVIHATWTGADGLIGANGVLGADQLQYLAWARSVSAHGLASDLFTLTNDGHVYLEPASGAVGGLLALGVSLVVGYLAVKAIAVIALGVATAAWVVRLLPRRRGAQCAAAALALFTVTPATALVNWLQTGSARFRFDVYLAGDELLAATKLWGYVPAALALALMVAALLCAERALDGGGARARWAAAGAALLCGWLHPWQGITLALIIAALALVRHRPRELGTLALALVAALVPLAYYGILAHSDPAWRIAAHNEDGARLPLGVLALCVGPLLALGALGVRRPRGELAEQALLLWVPAGLVTYAVNDAFSSHALEGLMIPLAVLAVRGAGRLRLPAVLGWLCVLVLTVPGLAYDSRKFVRTSHSDLVQYFIPRSDAAALRYLQTRAPSGGVLAPTPFATVVPSQTGRAVWVGHGDWSPHYRHRARLVDRLFDGRMASARARSFVRATGARILVADCAHRDGARALQRSLAPALAATRRFGCAQVYVLRRP
jgi:hypothetical protein